MIRFWPRLLANVVVGPFVGGVTLINTISIADALRYGDPHQLLQGLALSFVSPMVWVFGYVYGVVPALLTGLLSRLLLRRIATRGRRLALAALIGAVASMAAIGWIAFTGEPRTASALTFLALLGWTGAVAALASALLAERFERPVRGTASPASVS